MTRSTRTARRRRSDPAKGALDRIAMPPWWLALALGAVAYLGLHRIAAEVGDQSLVPIDAANWPASVRSMRLAVIAQYLLPALCAAAAALSALRRRPGASRRVDVAGGGTVGTVGQVLAGVTAREFELLMGEAFLLQGYHSTAIGLSAAARGGGGDLVLRKERSTYLVQCRHWQARKVGGAALHELVAAMDARGVAGGFIVTCGRFTREANDYASGRNIRLIEGAALLALVTQAQGARAHVAGPLVPLPLPLPAPSTATLKVDEPSAAAVTTAEPVIGRSALACPRCGAAMMRRVAKRGSHAGETFWGCVSYPDCRGTRRSV